MKNRKKKKGQVTLEMALLILAMLGMIKLVQNWADEINIFGKFLIEPWMQVRVMMESGVWNNDRDAGKNLHPSQRGRLYSSVGERP